jgi:regulatory protein
MRYCSRRECCSGQILLRLEKSTLSENEQLEILNHLVRERFVDDERFAAIYCRDKSLHSRWGWIKIRQHLKQWKLEHALPIAESVWKELNPNNDGLTALAASKWNQIPDSLPVNKRCARLSRFLLSRGYAMHDVIEAVRPYFGKV